MCRPFGTIESCKIQYGSDGLCRCAFRLAEADQHRVLAKTLGAVLENEEIHLAIRLSPRQSQAPAEQESDRDRLMAIEET